MNKQEIINRLNQLKKEQTALREQLHEINTKDEDKKTIELLKNVQIEVVSDSIIIIRGGLGYPASEFMDKVTNYILKQLGNPYYNCFIEHTLDNPWVRILVFNINSFNYCDSIKDVIEKIKVRDK